MNNELMAWIDEQIKYYEDWNRPFADLDGTPAPCRPLSMFEEIKKELTTRYRKRKEPVLTIDEIIYLKNTLRPFKDKISFVCLELEWNDTSGGHLHIGSYDNSFNWNFPTFALGTMYKNMKINKEYTLKELGITYE